MALPVGILQGSLVAMLHHSNAEHFEKVLSCIIEKTEESLKSLEEVDSIDDRQLEQSIKKLYISLHCLSVVAGIRQGSKIAGTLFRLRFKSVPGC